jgi:hypothetical protein
MLNKSARPVTYTKALGACRPFFALIFQSIIGIMEPVQISADTTAADPLFEKNWI